MANRLITINVRNYLVKKPVGKRHLRISKYVRSRVAHYTKTSEENVKITRELGALMVKSYAKSMLPLKLNVSIEKGIATVSSYNADKKAVAKEKTAGAPVQTPAAGAQVPAPAKAQKQTHTPDRATKAVEEKSKDAK